MSAQRVYTGLTYGEVRDWAQILERFTATDIAREMGVDIETGRKSVTALCMHGICKYTGDKVDGPHGYEDLVEYIDLPDGPTSYVPSAPDPVQAAIAGARIFVERGQQVRIRTERKNRRGMSTPGQRQKMKNQQRNWEKQQDAKAKRAEIQKSKAQKDPKWKKKK